MSNNLCKEKCIYCNNDLLCINNTCYYRCFNCDLLIKSFNNEMFIFSKEKIKLTIFADRLMIAPTVLDKNNCLPKYYLSVKNFPVLSALYEKTFNLIKFCEDTSIVKISNNKKILSTITPKNIDQKIKTILTLS